MLVTFFRFPKPLDNKVRLLRGHRTTAFALEFATANPLFGRALLPLPSPLPFVEAAIWFRRALLNSQSNCISYRPPSRPEHAKGAREFLPRVTWRGVARVSRWAFCG